LALNSFLKEEFEIHSKLQLPKQEIIFENKSQLKKRAAIVSWQFRIAVAAASIALLMSAFWFLEESIGFDRSGELSISIAESRNVSLKNTASLKIAERTISSAVFETKVDVLSKPKKEQKVLGSNETDKAKSIVSLEKMGQEIALTGKIECAKLMAYKQTTKLYWAIENTTEKRSGLLAKVFSNNANKFINAIKPSRAQTANSKENDPAFVKFLGGSVNVFNTITGSEVEQLKVYDSEGNLRNYKIETEMISLNKSISSPGLP